MRRWVTDLIVATVHTASIAILYSNDEEFAKSDAGRILLGMEITTIVFHAFYAVSLAIEHDSDFLPQNGRVNPYKWLEYSGSATAGAFAVAYANGNPGLSTSTLILLAGAGIAQQCSGFQLERPSIDGPSTVLAFFSALLLQVGEFLVVSLAISEGLDTATESVSRATTWRAFGTYVVGYGLFGVLMAGYLFATRSNTLVGVDNGANEATINRFEKMYSLAGLVAKLGLVFAEAAVHAENLSAADGILATTVIFAVAVIASLFRN